MSNLETILAEIQARCDAATEGPWEDRFTYGGRLGVWHRDSKCDEPDVCDIAAVPDDDDEANAAFIAHARTDLPRCMAALRVAMRALETLVREWNKVGDGPAMAHNDAITALAKITEILCAKETNQ